MSWMEKLYQTYEAALRLDLDGDHALMPISHTGQNAHINIVIDANGNFRHAEVLEKLMITLPATESSAGRTSGEAPHPLADKLQYVAQDYSRYGGKRKPYFSSYSKQLGEWCDSEFSHSKARAVYRYISRGRVIKDLIASGVLHLDLAGHLLEQWEGEKEAPKIFKVLPKQKKLTDQGSALVAWTVEGDDSNPASKCWVDESLQQSWINYEASHESREGLCFVSGEYQPLAISHPKKLRHSGDGAKLISANDLSGFTFRGRFTDTKKSIELQGNQAAGVAFITTQKAHNALRWLVERQGYRNGDQVYVSWAVSGKPLPKPTESSWELIGEEAVLQEVSQPDESQPRIDHSRNLGAAFANRINQYMAGYAAKLDPSEDVVVMGLDSATPGRMSVIYYRALMASEFIERLKRWHSEFSWYQRHKKELTITGKRKPKMVTIWPISSPAPRLIAEAAYGAILNDSLKKSVVERIMPCIIDGVAFPRDLMGNCVRRVSNRAGYKTDEFWRWEQDLGVACALYRGYYQRHPNQKLRKEYSMALEENNQNRDYLYGRLLAIAERIEEIALSVSGEGRSTTAARMMQRFADRPYSTWRNIELALQPYMQRLQVSRTGFLTNMKKELDKVLSAFPADDFTRESPLSGEFLLAYHCQRLALRNQTESQESDKSNKESN